MTGAFNRALSPPIWCVLIGAFSLVVGLATYGYNVTRTMGVAMAKLSPSRGFAAELSTALVILVASQCASYGGAGCAFYISCCSSVVQQHAMSYEMHLLHLQMLTNHPLHYILFLQAWAAHQQLAVHHRWNRRRRAA
jgi:Phosphate transporter family